MEQQIYDLQVHKGLSMEEGQGRRLAEESPRLAEESEGAPFPSSPLEPESIPPL